MYWSHLLIAVMCLTLWTCQQPDSNPPADGFNLEGSDAEAMAIADDVMVAMGGRTAWDQTRHIAWSFFGRRFLVWDKHTGDVRIDAPRENAVYLLNIHSGEGRVRIGDRELTMADSLAAYLTRGKHIWINDSYWLVMPFKLKDSGVTLTYAREDTLSGGAPAHVLQLTFSDVGNTPDNKYEVYVDQSDNLIKQWAFFAKYDNSSPNFVRPWDNYQTFGNIKLSADRSDNGGPSHVLAQQTMPASVYTSWDPPSFMAL